jgi:hypothetical protein
MAKKDSIKNRRGKQKSKLAISRNSSSASKNKKDKWNGIFDNVTYSSGPGDNIYVFG